MADSLQNIKRRVSGIANIGKITKAMELVAATKMRRSQEIALNSRPYAFTALDLLGTLSKLGGAALPPVLEKRDIKHTAIMLITSDKGLAGSFNSAVVRKFEKFLKNENIDIANPRYLFIAVGQKASRYLSKRAPSLLRSFTRVGDYTTLEETKPISDYLTNGYVDGLWDEIITFSSHFRSALRQEVLSRKIFPIDIKTIKESMNEIIPETGRFSEFRKTTSLHETSSASSEQEYIIEPSPEELLLNLVPHLVEMQIYHLILEANASEHAARRMAMKSASDNASELASDLSLVYNKARQAGITRELVEITAGAEASK